jgi:TfoX/Sxy family transcriptional regulator of competence genes
MKWEKAPQELKDLLASIMQGVECEKRVMFGYPAYFINRNMFAGLYRDKVFLRLPVESLSRLRKKSIALHNLEPMPGRPMKDYSVIPPEIIENRSVFRKLIVESADHAHGLARKAPRKPPSKGKRKPE